MMSEQRLLASCVTAIHTKIPHFGGGQLFLTTEKAIVYLAKKKNAAQL